MKVLNISWDDYANYAFDNCEALKSIGINAHSIKRVAHPFHYEKESQVVGSHEMKSFIQQYDIIQIFHSYAEALQICVNLGKKRIFVYHTGTAYRNNPDSMNAIFNPHCERCFTDQTEFIGLGMKEEAYVATAINVKDISTREAKIPFVFGHYPSNPSVKGTDEIIRMMSRTGANFKYSTERVGKMAQAIRVNDCDIYIELFKPVLNGKEYGCYGVSAFEAAGCGKVVITQNLHPEVYREAYGDCPFLIANTEEKFLECVETIMKLTPAELSKLQKEYYDWIVNKHSYKATGEYVKNLLKI